MRAASTVIFVGAGLFMVGWIVICVMYILTAEPDSRSAMIGPNISVLAIVAAILAPAVLLAIPVRYGHRASRVALTVIGVLYLAGGVMTVAGGELLGLPFVLYSLLWMVLLWLPGQAAGGQRH